MMSLQKFFAITGIITSVAFAQQGDSTTLSDQAEPPTQAATDALDWNSTPVTVDTNATLTQAQSDTAASEEWPAPDAVTDTTAADSTQVADSTATETADTAWVKPRNKITYAEYQAKIQSTTKKRSRTLHHGLSITSANYYDKRYGDMKYDADWGSGIGMYYFYRRYFGRYLGFQGRLGALYRYSRWNFDQSETNRKLDDGTKVKLTHNIDRKYHNFAADLPLTGKLGYHIKKTTAFIFLSGTLDITKPIFEMVDTENRLYMDADDNDFNTEIKLIDKYGNNPFPLYESHQTNKAFYMDDWETSGWIGAGIESRLVSVEFQIYAVGGASQNANHRYHHIGHDSHPTWRFFLDFSIR